MAYVEPTVADVKALWPVIANVEDATISFWLTQAHASVDQSWIESDYVPALAAVAVHKMIERGVAGLKASAVSGLAAAGVTNFKSGTFSASFSDAAAAQAAEGGWGSTAAGREYLRLLRASKGGARVTAAGVVPCCDGFNGFAGPLGNPAALFGC